MRSLFSTLKIPGHKLILYHKKSRTLENVFSKSYINFGYDNGLAGVYKIPCKNCDKCYVWETGRPFSVRLNEHKNFSGTLGKYATHDHVVTLNHQLDYDNSHIIFPDSRNLNSQIVESLFMN